MSRSHRVATAASALATLALAGGSARADDVLHPGTPALDPPTLTMLGVVLPITGDDNFTATVAVRYRPTGTTAWKKGMPLLHVHAEAVQDMTVAPQFAGTIFGLLPDTSYDIELHATDADGSVDKTLDLSGKTRKIPGDPKHPHKVMVSDASSLSNALANAQAGDVITLADGTYQGAFSFTANGTADDPIVIRGTSRDGAILDGMGCAACNVLEVYGSRIHIENLTLQHGNRAIRFQTQGAQENVVRRTHIRDVVLAIGSQQDQKDFYIADNLIEGRLVWPCVYASMDAACNGDGSGGVQAGLHANDDGVHVEGTGHVISHNTISGFGDAMKTEQDGARSVDFIGNDVLWTYDNAIELDGSSGNTRAYSNRFTNTYATLSFQPIFGGPAYAIRNVLVNVADEQFKLHSRGTTPTVGAVILHNTVVRGTRAIQCSTAAVPLHFTVENNLFVGPKALDPDGHAVRWDVPNVATGLLDYNGFFPDGSYEYGYDSASGGVTYPSFAALVAGGQWESHSVLGDASTLKGGLVGPADWTVTLPPTTPLLAAGSAAIDKALPMGNIDDDARGGAPDLGAIEFGCAAPTYGVRPAGVDESNEMDGCSSGAGAGGGAGASGAGAGTGVGGGSASGGGANQGGAGANGNGGGSSGGCGCRLDAMDDAAGSLAFGMILAGLVAARRRRTAARSSRRAA